MDQRSSKSDHMIDIESGVAATRTCQGQICGFSDAKTTSKDAQERSAAMKKLWIAIILCIIFMCFEVLGGIKSNSLAILTDAAHLLSDVAAFAISLFSLWASGWKATPKQSYGFFRVEILGALVSIQLIWILAGILVYEAIGRLVYDGGEVQGSIMFGVSAFGLGVNVVLALLLGHDHGHHGHSHDNDDGHRSHNHDHGHGFRDHDHGHGSHDDDRDDGHRSHDHDHGHGSHDDDHDHGHRGHGSHDEHDHNGHEHSHHGHDHDDKKVPLLEKGEGQKRKRNINVQGAYLHVLGDFIQSVGVMIGGAVIWWKPEWKIIDLICTLFFSVIVLFTTFKMLRSILEVLMESTPREIDAKRVEEGLCEMDEVVAIHELHIWAITVGKVLLACHVRIKNDVDADVALDKVIDYLRREFNIVHVTIQIERE